MSCQVLSSVSGNNPRSLLGVSALPDAVRSLLITSARTLGKEDTVALRATKEGMEK